MGITTALPGMKPGQTFRNIFLGGAYVSLLGIGVLGLAPVAITYKSWDGC